MIYPQTLKQYANSSKMSSMIKILICLRKLFLFLDFASPFRVLTLGKKEKSVYKCCTIIEQ